MEYYKILLVDDELEIRDGMIQKLDWHQLGYDVAAAAENGVEALEKADQVQPDVIMTDIRMPFMDGLEFIEKVIERLPAVKIIVFSGFDDFEYAQKAINLGVEEYILKPISAKQLEESLIKLKKKMDEELARKRDIAILRKSYEESFPILREQFFISMIEGRMTPRQIEVKMNQYGLSLSARHKTVAVLSANENSLSFVRKNVFAGEEELIPIVIKRTAEDIKIKIGTTYPLVEEEKMEVRGRNLVTGLPKTVTVTSSETEEALRESTGQIVEAVIGVLEQTPPELSADILDRGIVLTGGGALLRGLEELIEERTGINTMTAEDPMKVVAIGTGQFVEFMSGRKEF